MDEAENQINDLEHKEAKNNQSGQLGEKESPLFPQNKHSTSSLWDTFKRSSVRIIGVPEEEEEEEIGTLFEKMMKENIPNLVKEIEIQVQEAESPS